MALGGSHVPLAGGVCTACDICTYMRTPNFKSWDDGHCYQQPQPVPKGLALADCKCQLARPVYVTVAACRKGGLNDLNVWLVGQQGQQWGAFGTFPHYTTSGEVNACNDGIFVFATNIISNPPGLIPGTLLVHEVGCNMPCAADWTPHDYLIRTH
jgi:hypothetical protein